MLYVSLFEMGRLAVLVQHLLVSQSVDIDRHQLILGTAHRVLFVEFLLVEGAQILHRADPDQVQHRQVAVGDHLRKSADLLFQEFRGELDLFVSTPVHACKKDGVCPVCPSKNIVRFVFGVQQTHQPGERQEEGASGAVSPIVFPLPQTDPVNHGVSLGTWCFEVHVIRIIFIGCGFVLHHIIDTRPNVHTLLHVVRFEKNPVLGSLAAHLHLEVLPVLVSEALVVVVDRNELRKWVGAFYDRCGWLYDRCGWLYDRCGRIYDRCGRIYDRCGRLLPIHVLHREGLGDVVRRVALRTRLAVQDAKDLAGRDGALRPIGPFLPIGEFEKRLVDGFVMLVEVPQVEVRGAVVYTSGCRHDDRWCCRPRFYMCVCRACFKCFSLLLFYFFFRYGRPGWAEPGSVRVGILGSVGVLRSVRVGILGSVGVLRSVRIHRKTTSRSEI